MLNCEDEDNSVPDQYAFVMPESWLIFQSGESVELGQSVEFSGTCNPNFEAWLTCENAQDYNLCTLSVQAMFNYGTYNENNHFETFLQCPQCGCGAQGQTSADKDSESPDSFAFPRPAGQTDSGQCCPPTSD